MNEIIIFDAESQQVEVRLEGETLWLTEKHMGELFGNTSENILMHLKNIFQGKELDEVAPAKNYLVVRHTTVRNLRQALEQWRQRLLLQNPLPGLPDSAVALLQPRKLWCEVL